jgi:anthranilate synthase component 1
VASKNINVVAVSQDLSADLLTPVSAYLRLSQAKGQSFLLESVEGGERVARYSFLGVDPYASLSVLNGRLRLETDSGDRVEYEGNPLEALKAYFARYRARPSAEMPAFCGGAVGYLGYEMSGYLERLPRPAQRVAPLDAHLMLYRDVVAFDHVKHRVVLISNVFLEQEDLKSGKKKALQRIEALRARLLTPSPEERPLTLPSESELSLEAKPKGAMGERKFRDAVQKIKGHIRAGDIFQCVLSEEFELALKCHPFRIYRSLRNVSPAPYLFYLNLGDETLLGASPEMLVRAENGRIETCPIAGTRPRGRDLAEDKRFERHLLASVKEKAEHLMLVDLGRNDLGRVAKPGTVSVRDFMHVERFSHVMHLVSNVEAQLKSDRTAWDALFSCFPAGTLSGAPKIRAQQIIADLEPSQRGPYGGAVVCYDFSGQMNSCITIRSLYARGKKGYVRAGAGVVADSTPAREYQEIINKTRAIRRAIALAEAGGAR